MKTTEEASEDYFTGLPTLNIELVNPLQADNLYNAIVNAFMAGANWQKEQALKTYTEEEAKQLCIRAYNYGFSGGVYENTDFRSKQHNCNSGRDWFEKNKK